MRRELLVVVLAGCLSNPGEDTGSDTVPNPDYSTADACSAYQNLEIIPVDSWGRDLAANLVLNWEPYALTDPEASPDAILMPLGDSPITLGVRAEADGYPKDACPSVPLG